MKTLFFIGVVLLGLVPLALTAWSQLNPAARGVRDGRLAPCPDSPNCVSSYAEDPGHRVEPLASTGVAGEDAALDALTTALESMDRVEIRTRRGEYMHAVFTTPVFRFMDDVEFLYDPAADAIQVRSASRVGWSDLGANRKRVERLRAVLSQDSNEAAEGSQS